jgi:hypothetical protein
MQRRLGEHGTKVYFVKQLQVKEGDGADADSRSATEPTWAS